MNRMGKILIQGSYGKVEATNTIHRCVSSAAHLVACTSMQRFSNCRHFWSLQADKRAHHNALERKRRDHIKDSFSSLRDSVPALNGEKVSVRHIFEYILQTYILNNLLTFFHVEPMAIVIFILFKQL